MSWGRTRLGDAQQLKDSATSAAQHRAALDAIAARQAGDYSAYSDALQRLFNLGITNASAASDADLQQIANEAAVNAAKASVTGFVGNVTGGISVVLLVLGGAWLLTRRRTA